MLTSLSRKIEIYTMDRSGWTLSRRASPGNLAEVADLMDGAVESCTVLAIRLTSKNDLIVSSHEAIVTVDCWCIVY
jgi:hypothetical protein